MASRSTARTSVGALVDVILPLLIIGVLIALCVQLLIPFVGLLLWTIVFAICFYPVHKKLLARGVRSWLSATIIGTGLGALVLVPTAIGTMSAASNVPGIVAAVQSGERQVRPPPAAVNDIPVVGKTVYAGWSQASTNWPEFREKYRPQLSTFTRWLGAQARGTLVAILLLVAAIIFSAIVLAYAERTRAFIGSIFARVTGDRTRGDHYMSIVSATIKSVALGVIFVAFIQALLCGLGFFVLGIPGAGILSVAAMVLGVLQLPVVIVTIPAIIFAFGVKSTGVALAFTVWFLVSGLSDAALKPLLIGHGLEVPMPVILLGVIGGVLAYGLVGLFIGAVLLAVGWILLTEWLEGGTGETRELSAAE